MPVTLEEIMFAHSVRCRLQLYCLTSEIMERRGLTYAQRHQERLRMQQELRRLRHPGRVEALLRQALRHTLRRLAAETALAVLCLGMVAAGVHLATRL